MLTIHRTLKIYGPSDRRDQLEPQLIWATPRQRGFPPRGVGGAAGQVSSTAYAAAAGPALASSSSTSQSSSSQRYATTAKQSKSQQEAIKKQQEAVRKQQEALQNAAELKQMLGSLEKVDNEGRRASLLDALCSVDDILNLPVHPSPPGVASGDLVVDLLKHQVGDVVYVVFIYLILACRAKRCSGVLIMNTRLYQLRSPTNQFSFGSTEKSARRCVNFVSKLSVIHSIISAPLLQ
jgi:hypothetical protein